jgi:hypothetical protein
MRLKRYARDVLERGEGIDRRRFPVSVYSQRVQREYPRSSISNGQSSWALKAIGIFLFFGAVVSYLAGITLVWRGTVLERMWTFNPTAYKQLMPFGASAGVLFLLLSAVLTVAGRGWFKRCLWGWRLAVVIVAIQVLGDLLNVLMGNVVKGGIGFTLAGALLIYLLRSDVRAAFANRNVKSIG